MANPNFAGAPATAYPPTMAAPKELGFLQRAEGLSAGLLDLKLRLLALSGRVHGHGEVGGNPASAPVGLPATLSEAEGQLRDCMQILGTLNDAF